MYHYITPLLLIIPTLFFAQENLTEKSFEELDSLYAIYGNSDFQQAILYAQAAADKTEMLYGANDTLYGTRLISLGMQNYYLGNYNETVALWTKSKDIFGKVWGKEHPEYISILGNIALLHYYLGNYQLSEKQTLEVKVIREGLLGDQHYEYAMVLNNLGLLYWTTGRYEEAEGLYLKAKKIVEKTKGKEDSQYANIISNLASLYYDMGRMEEVEPLYIQTKDLMQSMLGKEHPNYASCVINLGSLYEALGNSYEAEVMYVEAKELRAASQGREHPEYAIGLRTLGMLYAKTGREKEGLKELLESRRILKEKLGEDHLSYLGLLKNLAKVYMQLGDYEESIRQSLESKSTTVRVLGKQHPNFFQCIDLLAYTYMQMGQYDLAWQECLENLQANSQDDNLTLDITEEWANYLLEIDFARKEHIDAALETIHDLLSIESTPEKLEKQCIVASLAIGLLEKNRKDYTGEEDKLRILTESAKWTHLMMHTLNQLKVLNGNSKYDEEAFKYAELNKSVLLGNAIQTERAYSFGGLPDTLVQAEKEWQESKSELKAALLEDLEEEEKLTLQNELGVVNLEISNLKKIIEKEYPKYSELKNQQAVTDLKLLQAKLDEKTALIEYVVSDSCVYIFYIDKQEQKMYSQSVPILELTAQIKGLHSSLSNYVQAVQQFDKSYRVFTEHAHWFYQNLLASALQNKEHISELVFITDGELGHLPFETFLVEVAPQQEDYQQLHYLINDYTISYAYSANLWEKGLSVEQKSGTHQMLALAADYSQKDSSRLGHLLPTYQKLRYSLQPLPNAEEEVKGLSALFEGDFLTGDAASEQFFKNKAKEYNIIHLAMHGVLDEASPILSGLAFTEDGKEEENNFLQAYEISQMDLNASLVVLSACETGYGAFEQGNGIASLARSFMYAGVPAMVVSLWQVNDQSTALIMNQFYDKLKSGMSKSEALRAAKLEYLKRAEGVSAHPAFWSPFVLIGSSEPVTLLQKRNYWTYFAGLGFFGLIAGFYLKKNKNTIESA